MGTIESDHDLYPFQQSYYDPGFFSLEFAIEKLYLRILRL
jgi:hypothetical protein